jgi:hypothetical protein
MHSERGWTGAHASWHVQANFEMTRGGKYSLAAEQFAGEREQRQ